ncbi:3-oxoacyl-[acyl-carrier-protein] reductase FabG [Pseudomonas fluorescens]|uniref:3-oxoacyl-[acyl-carrier-protein] reductase FabG n=1 Tax=Pseudomonas fluorescens TaxID=294 RepID=A0A5E6UJF7_PSEFL|nr:SDR family oxidoreductase [Pseudomonas fluorescens]VVN04978.1 3-oxoacyl-[acyl-carrier-protein] reductase FabG [Pseudomonas fluorescens]
MKSIPTANLQGQVAIVTGSTQGLGTDIARQLLNAGASVMLVGRNRDTGPALASELGERCRFVACNVELDEDIDDCIDTTLAAFGRLDILVNNACVYDDQGLQSDREQWLNTLNINLVSAAIFVQKATPHMNEGGTVINIGSTGGKFGAAGRALYPASKAGLLQLTRNLAVSLAPDSIRVISVSPAWTWSPSVANLSGGDLAVADRVGATFHPLGRVGRGEEIGQVVAFLCSHGASWITGVDIPVDGGFSILGPDQGLSPRVWFERLRDQPESLDSPH